MATYVISIPDEHEPFRGIRNGSYPAALDEIADLVLEAVEPGSSRHCLAHQGMGAGSAAIDQIAHHRLGVVVRRMAV